MEVKYALLGFLSWKSFSGYDLKKMLENSELFYWSGNNNQIYTALVQLHKEGLVERESTLSEIVTSRKSYRITEAGKMELNKWAGSAPALPQTRKTFLMQLAWSKDLTSAKIKELLSKYEYELSMKALMLNEQRKRGKEVNPARDKREKWLWEKINQNLLNSYNSEIEWVRELMKGMEED